MQVSLKLPFKKEEKERNKRSSPTSALAISGFFLVCIGASAFALLSEFPFNGNPIDWLKARDYADQGNKALKKFALKEAQDRFKTAIGLYPGDWRFHKGLGLAYRENDEQAAITSFQNALNLHKDAGLYLDLADSFIAKKELKKAEAAASDAKTKEPLNAAASAEMALVLQLQKKDEAAQKVFESSSTMEKDDARFWYVAARYEILKQDWQRAEASLKQATTIDKANPEYWEALGILTAKKPDLPNAEIYLRRAARLHSNNGVYWSRLGEVCRNLNRLDKAEEAYKHAVNADNSNSEYWLLWGLCMLVQERYEDAEKPLRHALELDQKDPAKWNAYINSLQKQKKYKEAAKQLEAFLAVPGNDKMVKTWAFLGGVLIEDGQYQKAKTALEKSKSLSKDPQEVAGINKMMDELSKRQKKSPS